MMGFKMTVDSCPLDYRYPPASLNREPEVRAETLYIAGGLYGNLEALQAILTLKAEEENHGEAVRLIFNGDFHWFDTAPDEFLTINTSVLAHGATRGNVETELARPNSAGGCGCNYPSYVHSEVSQRSDEIFSRLAHIAQAFPKELEQLAALPPTLVAQVGTLRVAVVHGDARSLAGWSLAEERLPSAIIQAAPRNEPLAERAEPRDHTITGTPLAQVAEEFREVGADVLAATHTCLPFALDLPVDGRTRLLINNGSAGMPNFSGSTFGLITRISTQAHPHPNSLYGITIRGVRCEAVPVVYDHSSWMKRFQANWPPASPAELSYGRRLRNGPAYTLRQAIRGRVENTLSAFSQTGD